MPQLLYGFGNAIAVLGVAQLISSSGFMGTQVNFILKVLILSLGVSALIKYGGPSLPIAPTSLNALIGVVTPTIVLAISLWWRTK